MDRNYKIAFVLQARTGSTRLPEKIIKPFYEGKSIIELIIERIKSEYPETKVLIATSSNTRDRVICEIAKKLDVECMQGSERNVLSRYIKACSEYQLDFVFRVCSDNPFLDVNSFWKLEEKIEKETQSIDYVSYKVAEKPAMKTHYGFWGELVSYSALKKIQKAANKDKYLEHVTNYIYENSSQFRIRWVEASEIVAKQNDLRLTLDTQQDFNILSKLFTELIRNQIDFNSEDITSYLETRKVYRDKMKEQIEKNEK